MAEERARINEARAGGLLAPYRVLDLSDEKAMLCGKILADLGADVIKIEPPGGDALRRRPPFYQDRPDPEGSLSWWAFRPGQRSLTLDLEAEQGRAVLRDLVVRSDILVESFRPGYLAGLGIDYADLARVNPRLIFVSVTPYGRTGPYRDWAAADLNVQGMGGYMYLTGDGERAPLQMGLPAAYLLGGAEGASAAMIALHYRRASGKGQHLDVSMQQCIVQTLLASTMMYQVSGREEMRGGAVRRERGNTVYTRIIWSCKDGFVHFIPIGGGGGASRVKSYMRLVEWMKSGGVHGDILTARDWNAGDMFNINQQEYDEIAGLILKFFATKTVAELFEHAIEYGLLLAPIHSTKDLMEYPQLQAREFFAEVENDQGTFKYPGRFAVFSETPLAPPRAAPRLGQHSAAILGELGYDAARINALRQGRVV